MENVPAMSGINKEREAARNNVKGVLGEASCKTDVLANKGPQLRNGYGAEALKNKNCGPAEIDGCNASVIETTYAPYPGLRGVHNNEESANNIVSEDCVDDVVQEDIKNVAALQRGTPRGAPERDNAVKEPESHRTIIHCRNALAKPDAAIQ